MTQNNIHPLQNHQASATGLVDDPLTELLRQGARKLIEEAVDAELEALLERTRHLSDDEGRRRVVRNGYLPERQVQTGIGEVTIKVPRVRDRAHSAQKKIRFNSSILPKYMRFGALDRGTDSLALPQRGSRPATSPRPWQHCWV